MKNIDIYDNDGKTKGKYEFQIDIDKVPVRTDLYNDVIRYQLLKKRQGSADTKGRSEVRGGGAKPWRQKGTGRARAGTRRSPLWVGGGIVFGPHPRDYSIKLPRKVRRIALKSAIAQWISDDRIKIIETINFSEPKTRDFMNILKKLNILEKSLIILSEDEYNNKNNLKSMRNIPFIEILSYKGLNLYSILKSRTMLITKNAMEAIEKEIMI